MTTIPRPIALLAVLCAALAAPPAFAQDAMQGMDMSHARHAAEEPAKPVAAKEPRAKKTRPQEAHVHPLPERITPPRRAATESHAQHAGALPASDLPAESTLAMQPPPPSTGPVQRLDIGAQVGIRPVVRGLKLEPMPMDMQGMRMQGGRAPADARSADYSDGIGHGVMDGMDMRDDAPLAMLRVDRFEYANARDGNGVALEAQGWYGNDANKLWLEAEGETGAGRLQDLRVEALWARPLGIYWDTRIGVRHDFGNGPGRSWAAVGVQGLAPYRFDVEATIYLGPSGRTAVRVESEYDLRLTQRLILQPRLEVNIYGRDDPSHGIGAGLADATAGLRLRYEITRKFAPYVGVEFERKFGKAADFARSADEPAFDPRLVAGLRFWF